MSYLITTGWWHDIHPDDKDNRDNFFGDKDIRGVDFHLLWYKAIRATGTKANIYIIDSASPVKPILSEGETLVSLEKNYGHSTKTDSKLAGVTRAHLMGMNYALLNDYKYWVYIEQDALVFGESIIEKCITEMTRPMCFGEGKGTPQPSQQSFMIIKCDYIPIFIKRLLSIKSSDKEISPELKFSIASSSVLAMIPESIYRFTQHNGLMNKIVKKIMFALIEIFKGYCSPSFGFGRKRPIRFNDSHFYFQHGNDTELSEFLKRQNLQQTK